MIRTLLGACRALVTTLVLAAGLTATLPAADTVKLAITDLTGLEQLQREFGAFVKVLGEASGKTIEFYPVTNRTAAIEALMTKRVDFVLTGPAEYVVMQKKIGATLVVGLGRPDYYPVLVAMADAGLTTPRDLKGKTVAFGDTGSTSQHLGPAQIIADYGVPMADITTLNTKRTLAFESLKKGQIAAAGMGYHHFLRLREKEASSGGLPPGAFRVIGRGPDLPNDLLMAGKHVDPAVIETMKKAFVEKSDELIAAVLTGEDNQKYKGMKFITTINDKDYDYIRQMYATIGHPEYSELIGE